MVSYKVFGAVTILYAATGADAFFRMECRGRLAQARMDPLLDFGTYGSHMHAIHGSNGFSETSTGDDLRNGDCTSCAAKEDMSAYWTPSVYFQHDNGTFQPVEQIGGMLAYYLFRDPKKDVKAFPKNFAMIAGSPLRRSYTLGDVSQPDPPQSLWASMKQTDQDALAQRAIGFNCLDYKKAPEASLFRHFMPGKDYLDQNCPDGIRMEIAFPSCWNGKDVTSKDSKSHVAYPDLVQDGNCPEDFPVRLTTLFYETIWATNQFNGAPGQFVIANGDPTGQGYHADFITGWEPDFLQEVIKECNNLSGELKDCPLLTLQSQQEQQQCEITPPGILAKEFVKSSASNLLNSLPGNVKISYGPEDAPAPSKGKDGGLPDIGEVGDALTSFFGGGKKHDTTTSSYSAPTMTYKPATSSSDSLPGPAGPAGPGGAVFIQSSPSTSSSLPAETSSTISAPDVNVNVAPAPPATTPAPAPSSDAGVSYEVVSTQTVTNGAKVEEIVWEEPVVYVTESSVTTTTVLPGGAPFVKSEHKARRSHMRRHGHHGHN